MQPSGPGVDSPSRAAARKLFFALWPDSGVRAQIEEHAKSLDAGSARHGRLSKPARYHLTLQFLGEYPVLPRCLVEDAARAAARVHVPPFELVLDQAGSFRNVWWLGCADSPPGLLALWQALGSELTNARIEARGADAFRPHVTIRRGGAALPATPIMPIHWCVRDFVLVDSQPPEPYTILHRWPLADAE